MKTYKIQLKHDKGETIITTRARNIQAAIDSVMIAEQCPRSAIGYWSVVLTKKQLAKKEVLP